MRKLVYFCVAATILLQACSTGKSFSKKRYGHLKWIDHDTKVEVPGKETAAAENSEQTKRFEETEVIAPKNENTTFTAPAPADRSTEQAITTTSPVSTNAPAPSKTTQNSNQPEAVNQEVKDLNQETTTLRPSTREEKHQPVKPMMDDDVKLIICVILALFIPPLAMYLWDRQTDVWFIVDLILFLLWIFVIIGYGWGLAALLSIIIALLRIFELI